MQKAIMEPFARLIKPKTLAIFTKKACQNCAQAKTLLNKIEAPYNEHEVSKFKEDELRHLNEISGTKMVPKVFIGMKCIGGNEELQQSWKKRVLYDWLRKEEISFKETSENMDMASGKEAGKDAKMKDKKTEGKKNKKEETSTSESADEGVRKEGSKKKNDSQLGNREYSGNHPEPETMKGHTKNGVWTTTTSSADDAGHKTTSKKRNASQVGNKGAKVGGTQSAHKGASGTKDEGPLSHLGVKNIQSPGESKTTKEHAQDTNLGANVKQEGRIGTRQTDQPKKGMGLNTGAAARDQFAGSSTQKGEPLSTQKGGSGTFNPAEKLDDSHVDHPLGLKAGVSPDEQTKVGDKHPNKLGTQKGDMRQHTTETGKETSRRMAGNHGVNIGQKSSPDHRVNHNLQQERQKGPEKEAQ